MYSGISIHNEGPRVWKNLFALTRFRFMEVLFHIFYYYWGKKYRSLYRGLLLSSKIQLVVYYICCILIG